jgi:hypothetical protein
MGLMRTFDILLLLPGLFGLFLIYHSKFNSYLLMGASYIAFFIFFFTADSLFHLGLVNFIIQKQALFELFNHAQSSFHPIPLTHSWTSFVYYTPAAIFRTLTTPSPFHAHSKLEWINGVEHFLYLIIIMGFLGYSIILKKKSHPYAVLFLFYSLALFLFIGWIVPNSGSMVRYSAIPFLFFSLFVILLFSGKSATSNTNSV